MIQGRCIKLEMHLNISLTELIFNDIKQINHAAIPEIWDGKFILILYN